MKNSVTDVMIDLETLGTKPGATILSIGAVAFNRFTGTIESTFYVEINQDSSRNAGLTASAGTIAWWATQGDEAQALLTRTKDGGQPLRMALNDLLGWLTPFVKNKTSFRGMWANDPEFDLAILVAAMEAAEHLPSWPFWAARSCRTAVDIGQMFGTDPKRTTPFAGVKHNALDDAIHQTNYVCAILSHLALHHMPPESLES